MKRKVLNDILVIPYKSFKERVALIKAYEKKAKKIEIIDNLICINLKEHSGLYEL